MKRMSPKTILAFIIFVVLFFDIKNAGSFEYLKKKSTEYNQELKMNTREDLDLNKLKQNVKNKAKSAKKHIKETVKPSSKPVIKNPSMAERKNTYTEINDKLNLTMAQKIKFYTIMKDEKNTLRPMTLDLASKQIRLTELNKINCSKFDFKCKKDKKKKIETVEFESNELKRQIRIKKEYYMILYKNVLTREQGLILDEIIHDKALGSYVNN